MTTREQQIEQAERVARLNPEWLWDAHYCDLHRTAGPEVAWLTERCDWRVLRGVKDVPLERFISPADALRFLGFTIIEQEQEP